MPRKLTVASIEESPFPQRVGDVHFFPRPMDERETAEAIRQVRSMPELARVLPRNLRPHAGFMDDRSWLFWLGTMYHEACDARRAEPLWIRRLPRPLKRHLRNNRMHTEWYDPIAILPGTHYDGLRYLIHEGGFTSDAFEAFPRIGRLNDIRQLGYLHHALSWGPDGASQYGTVFRHTRYMHVLKASVLMRLVGTNAHLRLRMLRHAVLAALTHDVQTAAGGDTTKLLDPKLFDEDLHFARLLAVSPWEAFRKRYDIDPELLISTVQGRGLLGQLLDVVDRIAYIGDDVWVVHHARVDRAVRSFVRAHPDVCTLWETIRVFDDRVVFTDPKRLFNFLKLRVLMFKHVYWNPHCRHLEFLLGRTVMRYLYDHGILTRDRLLEMADTELDQMIGSFVGVPNATVTAWAYGQPQVETFATLDEARRRARLRFLQGDAFIDIESAPSRIKTGSHYLVQLEDERVVPFGEAFPDETRELEALAEYAEPHRVYSVRDVCVPPNIVQRLRMHTQQRLQT